MFFIQLLKLLGLNKFFFSANRLDQNGGDTEQRKPAVKSQTRQKRPAASRKRRRNRPRKSHNFLKSF